MEGRVIEYRPIGGGLDYHNSPLIGEIPTNDLYHTHRSIDQLRSSLNERGVLTNGHLSSAITDLKAASAVAALQLDYKHFNNNNNGELRHQHHHQHHQHHHSHNHHQQQQHHDDVDYLKHVADLNGTSDDGNSNGACTTDGNMLIAEQAAKLDLVLKQVEKHEVDSIYHASGTPSPLSPVRTERRGRKKVYAHVASMWEYGIIYIFVSIFFQPTRMNKK